MTTKDLKERTLHFGIRIVRLVESLPKNDVSRPCARTTVAAGRYLSWSELSSRGSGEVTSGFRCKIGHRRRGMRRSDLLDGVAFRFEARESSAFSQLVRRRKSVAGDRREFN